MPQPAIAAQPIHIDQLHSGAASRDTGLDAVRCIATIMVVLIHVSGTGFPKIMEPHWWAVNTAESISRASVPLFFMITGALLLNKNHTVVSVFNRIWRVALPLLAWSIAYKFWNVIVWKQPFLSDVKNWMPAILSNPVAGHLWYLYALIPAYAFIPVLSRFFQEASVEMRTFILGSGVLLASIFPFLNGFYQSSVVGFPTGSFYIYGIYMLAGAMLYHGNPPSRRTVLAAVLVWPASVTAIAYCTYASSAGKPVMNEVFYEYWSPFVFTSTIAAFIVIRSIFSAGKPVAKQSGRLIAVASKLSFGIYMVHPMIIWTFSIYGMNYDSINKWFAIPLLVAGVTIVSGVITAILHKIPGVRQVVPG